MEKRNRFVDWAGEKISYQVRTPSNAEPHEKFVCDIAPHGEWVCFGRGCTATLALQRAIAAWNDYDTRGDLAHP